MDKTIIEELRKIFYRELFESDKFFNKSMAKWESGLWVRYKVIEEILDELERIE